MPRGRKSQLHGIQLRLDCEWANCGKQYSSLTELKLHQSDHYKVLKEEAAYTACTPLCGICHASLNLNDNDSVERHSYYHAWSIQLRVKGRELQELNNWPPCLSDGSSRKMVPELPTKFECGWEYCDYRTNDISEFFSHVSGHSEEYTDSRYPAGVDLRCLWENCQYVAPRLKNLTSHLVTHTQNKRVACPTCGLLLVSFIKFENHLKCQQVQLINQDPENARWHPSVQPMRCSRCQRLFATERLLIAHMQRHINTVKCPLCDMTVYGKFASSPVRGPLAAAGALGLLRTSESDDFNLLPSLNPVDTQSYSTHPTRSRWIRCTFPDCNFKTTKPVGFQVHIGRKHTVLGESAAASWNMDGASRSNSLQSNVQLSPKQVFRSPLYACHLCNIVKRRGFDLSKHLMREHKLSRPSGHTRFTYVLENDGVYRLERTRLDTISVAAALLGEHVVNRLLSNVDTPVCLSQ
ncbi:putative Mizf protein [Fasciolopsis buskii]|uniref:Putative Mizf protein n=1 Tax=Fasciolopsis buskii TaxID=27845 RepID=A0A8E0RNW7_9TREM|nr:putative Mizf protein [Fasciolopsis buski]